MREFTCIICPMGCSLKAEKNGADFIVEGNSCDRGRQYAINELTSPVRTITTTIRINSKKAQVVSVKTSKPVPKDMIYDVVRKISESEVSAPVKIGDIAISNVLNTGSDIIITKNIDC